MADCESCANYEPKGEEATETFPIKDWENSYRVFAVQNMLHYIGIPTSRDGTYGNTTKENVKRFQKLYGDKYGLDVDGIVGLDTFSALAKECIYTEKQA